MEVPVATVTQVEIPITPTTNTPETTTSQPNRQAEGWRMAANGLSVMRALGGVGLGIRMAVSEYPPESYAEFLTVAGLSISDGIDGKMARHATSIDGQKSEKGAQIDQVADKVFAAGLIGGIVIGSIRSERSWLGGTVLAAGAVFGLRDAYVNHLRNKVRKANPNISTAAQWHGKVKTTAQMAALLALTSPAMESTPASWSAAGLLWGSALLGIFSARKYKQAFKTNE